MRPAQGFALSVLAALSACRAAPVPDTIAIEVMRELSSKPYQGREAGTPGAQMAHDYLKERLEGLGCLEIESKSFSFGDEGLEGQNLFGGILAGDDNATGLIISAHYDHLGIRDGKVFNGADDNASGVGAALAIAESFCEVRPKHNVIFAFFDAEEKGLAGAKDMVDDYSDERAFLMNLDMVSQNADGVIYASGTRHYPEVREIIEALEFDDVTVKFGHDDPADAANDWTTMSDHAPFHAAGIPYVYFGVEDHAHYHKASDEFETVPLAQYVKFVDALEQVARALDANLLVLTD